MLPCRVPWSHLDSVSQRTGKAEPSHTSKLALVWDEGQFHTNSPSDEWFRAEFTSSESGSLRRVLWPRDTGSGFRHAQKCIERDLRIRMGHG